ncbi:type II toxin-antitoxin system RelE/ParE family toxin, partial [Patescibacteria group bacterium]|nr:type II toxin-antitoxin system RelE/ParE family toxin [Patescibacteria group bacterium]
DKKTREKLKSRLIELKANPLKGNDIKRLQGYNCPTYRLRLGKIRIIFTINNNNLEIIDIDYRGNIY